jgi:IS5 family transposase
VIRRRAGWTRKNGRSRFGYEAHAAVDEGSGLARKAVLTPADVHDSVMGDDLVQGDEEAVYADKARPLRDGPRGPQPGPPPRHRPPCRPGDRASPSRLSAASAGAPRARAGRMDAVLKS